MRRVGTRGTQAFGRWAVMLAVVAAATGTSGCKKILQNLAKKAADAGAGGSPSAQVAAADDPDDQLQEKVDEYIKCLNTLSSSIHNAQKRYLSTVPRKGPTGHESWADIYTLPDGAAANCAKGVAKAKAMPPPNPALEKAGEDFSKYATELDGLITQADKYFENKDFRDDKWEKGKALHPQLMEAWANFSKADNQLHATLDGITKPLAQRTLARIEKEEGKKFRWNRKHVLNTARDLVEASDPPGDEDDIDFALYSSAYDDFEKAVDELTTYGNAHKKDLEGQQNPAWPLADNHYDDFVKAATDYKKAAKDFWRCLRDAPAKSKAASGRINIEKIHSCPEGRPLQVADEVVKKYNDFIHVSNDAPFP